MSVLPHSIVLPLIFSAAAAITIGVIVAALIGRRNDRRRERR